MIMKKLQLPKNSDLAIWLEMSSTFQGWGWVCSYDNCSIQATMCNSFLSWFIHQSIHSNDKLHCWSSVKTWGWPASCLLKTCFLIFCLFLIKKLQIDIACLGHFQIWCFIIFYHSFQVKYSHELVHCFLFQFAYSTNIIKYFHGFHVFKSKLLDLKLKINFAWYVLLSFLR